MNYEGYQGHKGKNDNGRGARQALARKLGIPFTPRIPAIRFAGRNRSGRRPPEADTLLREFYKRM